MSDRVYYNRCPVCDPSNECRECQGHETVIDDHPFVPGDPEYGWEKQCGFHVFCYGAERCCGYPAEKHTHRIPRDVYLVGLAKRRNELT